MTIEEQLQIVEDNLNEYGQCNITLEEYNFLKDELYSSGCLAGIELGRAEVIEKCKHIVRRNSSKAYKDIDGDWVETHCNTKDVINDLEQLKENKLIEN